MSSQNEDIDTQKVVVNRGYGGFSVHDDTVRWMREHGSELAEGLVLPGESYDDGSKREVDDFRDQCYPRGGEVRTDDTLIAAVEEGVTNDLSIVEIPADVDWVITEYDGAETVREKHRVFPSGKLAKGIARSYEVEDDE